MLYDDDEEVLVSAADTSYAIVRASFSPPSHLPRLRLNPRFFCSTTSYDASTFI
jgi:hypothetical protein